MDKRDLKKLAVMGIASGLIFSADQAEAAGNHSGGSQQYYAGRNGCSGGHGCGGHDTEDSEEVEPNEENDSAFLTPDGELNEKGLLSQLSDESKEVYYSLDESEKQLVLRLAKQFRNKNAAVLHAKKQAEQKKSQERAERTRRPITLHSLFR